MSLRYRFIDLASIANESELLAAIAPPASGMQAFALMGQPLVPFKHVVQLLRTIGAKTLLVQDSVRDPDFLAEHEAFYSKQHRVISRLCWRLHAFAADTPAVVDGVELSASAVLEFLDSLSDLDPRYLGFVTIRPLRHAPVGASILPPPVASEVTCHERFPVHIAGRTFQVSGTPYLQQDNAVGACAQASIWIALRTQMKRVGNTAFTPAELTRAVSAGVILTHPVEVKLTHLGEDGGFVGAVDVDPGASSGDTCDGPKGRRGTIDCEAAWLLAQHGTQVPA